MLWAIDVGNTQTVVGVHDGSSWIGHWRLETDVERTADELASTLSSLARLSDVPFSAEGAILASVVPPMNFAWHRFCEKWLGTACVDLANGDSVGLKVDYTPPTAVGADRIANALGALSIEKPPIIVVDFGTATTLDCIGPDGTYVGGTIMTGIQLSLGALVGKTAKLPAITLEFPAAAIGKSTVQSIQAGVMIGYMSAIDGLVDAAKAELGPETRVLATGGLAGVFHGHCRTLSRLEPNLTLEGLRIAWERLSRSGSQPAPR